MHGLFEILITAQSTIVLIHDWPRALHHVNTFQCEHSLNKGPMQGKVRQAIRQIPQCYFSDKS
jgi:hypothetical protein